MRGWSGSASPVRWRVVVSEGFVAWFSAAAAAAIAGVLIASSGALAQSSGPFTLLAGTWSGAGQIRLADGKSEALKCKAYYTDKDRGVQMSLALRCASASNKIDLRAALASNAGRVSGNWEERQFNAAGDVTGQATANKLNLSISGGGISGTLAVATTGSSQTVAITTEGVAFKGVTIALNRD